MSSSCAPNDSELTETLSALRAQNPTLGIAKLHAALLASHPDWTVSEKRTRKILQQNGLVLGQTNASALYKEPRNSEASYPTSNLVEGLDVTKWTSKVEVRYFGRMKGKGLVAKERITANEVVWKEDPFILAPEWEIYDLQASSAACAHCSTPIVGSPLSVPCPASHPCTAVFCSRLCLSRSSFVHPLLCPARNPASISLLDFARKQEWMALHALSRCTARVLLQEQQDETAFQAVWEFVRSLAQLGMEDRAKGGWLGDADPDRETWKKAYELYLQAFQLPDKSADKKTLARVLKRKKPLRKDVVDWLFDYDAFLLGLGRMSLNLEAHGGLYMLHSHMNHDCDPNISVRHLDQRTALARISVIARHDIKPGDELTITYVNPQMAVKQRRQNLLEWGFGQCQCTRCCAEEKAPDEQGDVEAERDLDLVRELKAGLGVR